MKKITLSLASVIVLSGLSFAGGDISPAEEPVVAVPVVEDASGFYMGAGLALINTRGASADLKFFSDSVGSDRLGGLTLLAGYDFNRYIAAEGRFTFSFSSGDDDPVDFSSWAIFVKPQYPVSEYFKIYALLGYGGVTMDEQYEYLGSGHPEYIYPTDIDDSGFQWGVGAAFSLKGYIESDVSIFVDYTSLANDMEGIYWNGDTEADADAITVGVTYKF